LSAIEPKIDFLKREKEKADKVSEEEVVATKTTNVKAMKTKSEEME